MRAGVMLFIDKASKLPTLDRVIDYTPPIVSPETTAIATITLMEHWEGDRDLNSSAQLISDRHNYDYVLVVRAARPIGILTRSDVVRLVVAGTDLAATKIVAVMTAPVITLERATSVDALTALSLMRQHRIHYLPIVDRSGLLVGMVTEDDLCQYFESPILAAAMPTLAPEPDRQPSQSDGGEICLVPSHQDLSDFIENAVVCLHWVAADGTIIWANQAELDLLGYTSEEYIGHSIIEFHADRAVIDDILDRLLHDRAVREYEADLICKDGSRRHVLIDSNSSWRNGEFVRTRCFTRDITKRKRAEEDLQRFNAALSHAMEGIAFLNPQGYYVWANQAYATTIGYSPEAIVGMDWQRTVHPDDLQIVELAYGQMLDRGKVEVAARGLRKDGSVFYKQLVMVTAYDSQQQLTGHYCFMKDITAAKQAEADLIRSEQKFRAIFDSLLQFIAVLTPDGIVMEANRTALEGIAIERADVIGKPFWETPWWTHSPQLQERLKQAIVRAANGELVQFESEHFWADGTPAIVDFSLKPVFDAAGQVVMLIPEGRDITDRKHKEDIMRNIALGVSAKTGDAFFEALVEYITKALRVEYAFIGEFVQPEQNRVRTIAGYGNDRVMENCEYELSATPCEHLVDLEFYVCPDRVQQQFPDDVLLKELDAQSYMGILLRDSAGQALGLMSVLSCQPFSETQLMTEILNIFAARAAAELERQQSQMILYNQKQDLARSNDDLQQFAYVASHDLQEPLRMIASYLELLERRYKGQLDAKADTFIAYAVDGATRMQTLINDLLNYSRVGRQVRDFEAVDCDRILAQVSNDLQVTIAQNRAVVTYAELPQVYGDPSQLTQLFQNLVSNAIKFRTQEPPLIQIGAEYIDGKWLFSVRDNGIGMDDRYLERIFIIFQRLHGKTEYPGTGIGLAVCKKIVERHGGKLWVEAPSACGSTFYFTLFPSCRLPMLSSPTIDRTIQVLLVEDNLGDVELTRLALEESALSIDLIVVGDGAAALEFLQDLKQDATAAPYPDLILLDLNLPKKSGHEVLAAIKTDRSLKRIPVLVLTTSQAEEDILQAYDRYASGYITKPASFERFVQVVRSIENFWFSTVILPPA
ncbi:PAS domain S-box protein [Chamaesiphon polymorphus]|nr:PAS domain S-box protein [Chamaesiphon polymorphus]